MAVKKPKSYTIGMAQSDTQARAIPTKAAVTAPYKPPAISSAVAPSVGVQYQTPNWAALIAGDPSFMAAQSEMETANRMDRGSLRDSIRRAVIESGLQPGQDEDIDAGTLAAASANQFSSAADIANQLRKGSAQSDAELASRGILSSGQFTENRSVLQKGADTSRDTLQNALLNAISTGRSQYASTVADRAGQLRGIRESIAERLAQNPGIWQSQSPIANYGSPAAAAPAAARPAAAPAYREGTIDGAGHVFRGGRWVPIGGASKPSSYTIGMALADTRARALRY